MAPSSVVTVPSRLGKYRLVRRLAVGGMAEVYLAVAEGLSGFEKTVVLKRLHPQHTRDPELLARIAQVTGGAYFTAASRDELQAIYDELDPNLTLKPQATEITAIFGGFGLFLLVIGGLASLAWNGRVP